MTIIKCPPDPISDQHPLFIKKSISILDARLNDSVDTIISRAVEEYDVRAPLVWALSDMVEYLTTVKKEKKGRSRKIKISSELKYNIENMGKKGTHFQFVVNTPNAPTNLIELVSRLLDDIGKTTQPDGIWVPPKIQRVEYPCICSIGTKRIADGIVGEKSSLDRRLKDLPVEDHVAEMVMSILSIENLIVNHIDSIEKYFAVAASNITLIMDGLKQFHSSQKG